MALILCSSKAGLFPNQFSHCVMQEFLQPLSRKWCQFRSRGTRTLDHANFAGVARIHVVLKMIDSQNDSVFENGFENGREQRKRTFSMGGAEENVLAK